MNNKFTYTLCFLCLSIGSLFGVLFGALMEETHYRKWAYDSKVGEDYIGYDHKAYFRMKTDIQILREHGCLDK